MALYMDRHDVPETVTAETVAHIHQEDLKLQEQFGCQVLTYWYDEKRKNAFCLIEAPNAKAIQDLHNQAHGQIPNSIIEVNASIVESFLGRIDDPENSHNTELNIIDDSAIRTIMVVSSKRLMPTPNYSAQFISSLQEFNTAVLNLLHAYKGSLVKQTENKFLVSFKSVTNAVQAALGIAERIKDFGNNIDKDLIAFRIGLSTGLPVTEKKLIFEDTVKLAERMCTFIKGEIIVSSEVKELYNSENPNILQEEERLFCLTPTDEKFLTSLLDYTESCWSNPDLKLDDFSKPLGHSKSQLYRKMINLTGKSPNTFITDYRLNEAVNLLNRNSSNVADISYRTGFTSPSYFSKCFKKKFGYLPSEYLTSRFR